MCQLAGPAPALGQWRQGIAWGRRPRAQSHLPNGLFQKAKEKTKQPYTKYSVASPKGCTEFLALCSTECAPSMCTLSPAPSSPRQGRGSCFNPPNPQPGESSEEGLGMGFFVPCTSPFPLKGGLGHFLFFIFCQVPTLKSPSSTPSPSLLWGLPPPDYGKVVVSSKG